MFFMGALTQDVPKSLCARTGQTYRYVACRCKAVIFNCDHDASPDAADCATAGYGVDTLAANQRDA
jgi:hypothetical protein